MPEHHLSAALWDTLGIHEKVSSLVSGLSSGEVKTALITGPPGTGKTWLARSIAADFVQRGGAAFRGVGDDGEANRRLYAFQRAQTETGGYFKPALALSRAIVNVATKVATGGLLDAEGAIDALSAEAMRRKRSGLFLTEAEQSVLSDIARDAAGKPVLLVADNLHWWDEDSLSLLRTIMTGEIVKAYPFAANFRLLGVVTDEAYQMPVWRETFEKRIIPLFPQRVCTRYLTNAELNAIAQEIGLPNDLGQDERNFIFDVSGGHLTIISEASKYLSEKGGCLDNLSIEDRDQFIDDLFLERLRKVGSQRGLAENLLGAAAIMGTVAFRSELLCLLKDEHDHIPSAINACRRLGFIEESDDRIEFRHDFIRRFFSNRLGPRESQLRTMFAECLRALTPWDYVRRASNLLRARDTKRAVDFFVLASLDNLRAGLEKNYSLEEDARDLIRACGYEDLLNDMAQAYRQLSLGENDAVLSIVEGIGPAYPPIILAEMEFLRSQADLHSRSDRRRQALIGRLKNWKGHIEQEFEQGLRLMVTLRSALVLELDKQEARDLDAEITRRCSERIYFDKTAEAKIHALSRSAESLYLPDIALRRVEQAERYHRPLTDAIPAEPSEYFRCLTNLAALYISNGHYDRAIGVALQGIELADRFEDVVFPRRDMIHTMYVMASFRAGQLSAADAVSEQKKLIEQYGVKSDPFYPLNHLGVYLCLAGEIPEGISIFQDLRSALLEIGDPEANAFYFVSANLCSARFLAGEEASKILSEWKLLTEFVERNPYETRPLLLRRHKLIAAALEQNLRMSPAEWDEYPLIAETRPLHRIWPEIGRGFRMPDVQFWSMY